MRLLLIEGERELANSLVVMLGKQAIIVDHTMLMGDGLELVQQNAYDAIILDRLLPDGDGFTFILKVRQMGFYTPIIVVTASNLPHERVEGLNLGADDYLGKPFFADELLARLRAVLRRPVAVIEQQIAVGRMLIDTLHLSVQIGTVLLGIPRRELLILVALAKRVDKTVGRATLEAAVYSYDEEIQSNALDAHISRLRKRLSDAEAGVSVHNVRGVGYLLRSLAIPGN